MGAPVAWQNATAREVLTASEYVGRLAAQLAGSPRPSASIRSTM